ncbi:hypothetical protein SAMN04488109_2863 [Chryseolinea serpens]|uniref:3-oxoacyl-ACP synthase n=1 Tax=Chryseolinea serpens TaxID=947013 RepID=A0A1M5QKT0_9BACT|nr:hypothetical protein [Chryseolinea serpens]SHH14409.1 hypothetical protein SAMN04488109_2863 [Chryseolinea serpens]
MLDLAIKGELLNACKKYAEQRLATATQAMHHAQQAANEEGKSSAGDKYETGRAMAQIERDKAAQQAQEALKLKQALDHLDGLHHHQKVTTGSVVATAHYNFYIAIGAGKMTVSGLDFIVVGPGSPLGKSLMGLTVNDAFTFNNQHHKILQVL